MYPTVLIGLDGATFSILNPLMEIGAMPFLKEFTNKGASAELLSTSNPLTPPAWVALMTGRSPGNHGIFDFIWSEERESNVYFTLHNFRDIQCETIWSIVNRHNGKICSLNFPMMSPPPEVTGIIVPGLVSWKHLHRNIHPRDVYQELKSITGFNVKELAWDFNLEKKASRGIPQEEFENWVAFHIRREEQWFNVTTYLMKNHPSDLTAILFDGPDKIFHMGWRFLDPSMFPETPTSWEKKIRDLCIDYFRQLDSFLAEIKSTVDPKARVFMVSDHGFGPSWFVFRVNTWLHEQGYLNWKEQGELDDKSQESVKRLIENHFVYLDWNTTTAYARTTTSNGIYIRVARQPGQTGVPVNQYESFRSNLVDKLLAIMHPATGERIVKRVLTKEEAYPGENNQGAPDLTLVMTDYSFVSILDKKPIVCPRPEIEGTHYPEGIFIANGPGIQKGFAFSPFSIIDVAPCLLYSLGLEIPSNFEGCLPMGIFDELFLENHPFRIGEPTQTPDSYALRAKRETGKTEDKEIYKQLKMLGYIE
jgi:predicted AlkP superfamily phosphohydrolase/phosphomutase